MPHDACGARSCSRWFLAGSRMRVDRLSHSQTGVILESMSTSPPRDFIKRGGVWVLAQSGLMLAVIVLGVLFHGDWNFGVAATTGLGLLGASAWFGIAGVSALGRNRTPFPQPTEGSQLVQRGIYSVVRHPLYTSVILGSFGWALLWESGPSLIAALASVPFFRSKARCEERWLRKEFAGYADYESSVPRFIPRLFHSRRVT